MEKTEITIVGAGIIGLACAAELSKEFNGIVVVERNSSFGQETSSRNSEVIHAGIYYPVGSLKARLCVEGKGLLYSYCRQHSIAYSKMGKLIVATNTKELKRLEELLENGLKNGVSDLRLLSNEEVRKLEPQIDAIGAIYSPSTGIFDSSGLMKSLESESQSRKVKISYCTELVGVEKVKDGYKVTAKDEQEGSLTFFTRIFINTAGLNSDKVARMAGIEREDYNLKYCKGDYFRVHHNKAKFLSHLIYPAPAKESVSLGIHTALDLDGGLRLGPDAEYIDRIDYKVDEGKKKKFYESARSFLPFINLEDLAADISGIRAKLQGPGEAFRDFLIREEADQGLPGFINLIGIDSPGLTCVFPMAKKVRNIIKPLM